MATVEECEKALHELATTLADRKSSESRPFDRVLACTVKDLETTFIGDLSEGRLNNIRQTSSNERAAAQIKLTMTSDDLIKLVAGEINVAAAWATKRIKVEAGMRDMLRLRSMF